MSLGRFPVEMPTNEILTVINFLRGKNTNKKEAIEGAWWAAGYAGNQLVPTDKVIMFAVPDDYDLASALESVASMKAGDDVDAIDWKTLAAALWGQAKIWIDEFLKGL